MEIDQKAINYLKIFSVKNIINANSGHCGISLDSAPTLYSLYCYCANFYPKKDYFARDRIVLSAGHCSSLLYSIFYALDYNISANDLKRYRQINSITSGHPEIKLDGVEAGTGPIGEGVANAVGMAIGAKYLKEKYNKSDVKLFDNYVYAFVGDGCLMEGVAQEALSLAGTFELDNLILLYDCNKITIDGSIDITEKDNIRLKYEAINFNVINVKDGSNYKKIISAIESAKKQKNKPSLIIMNTIIGCGTSIENTPQAHRQVINNEDFEALQDKLCINFNDYKMDSLTKLHFLDIKNRQKETYEKWLKTKNFYRQKYPNEWLDFSKSFDNEFKINILKLIKLVKDYKDNLSTRECSHIVLNLIKDKLPNLIGGSADVSASTKSYFEKEKLFSATNYVSRNIPFGVREHAMAGIENGIVLNGGFNGYCSCFLSFSDFLKPALRMSCIQNLPVLYLFSHDSIGTGEDGPTHQPIEHIASLRLMPNLYVFRPCGIMETIASYEFFVNNKKPLCILLSRQNIEYESCASAEKASKGAYVIKKEKLKVIDYIIIATGSEVPLAVKVACELEKKGQSIRVVSMPCVEVFEEQSKLYKNEILCAKWEKTISLEAGTTGLWKKYGKINIGIDTYGKSGNQKDLFEDFGFTVDKIIKKIKNYE